VKRAWKRLLPAAVVGLLLLGGLVGGLFWLHFRGTATGRLARHFGLLDVSTPAAIERGLLRQVPEGTPEAEIEAWLVGHGIGKDGLSSWYPPEEGEPAIVCRIELDPDTPGFVKESYGILFHLDAAGKLERIEVRRWLTGP